MKNLTRNKRQSILRRAAEIYRSNEASWVRGQWIVLRDMAGTGQPPRLNSAAKISVVRKFLGRRVPDQTCFVCLEGVLMLALAEDTSVPADIEAYKLVNEFRDDVFGIDFSPFGINVEERALRSTDLVSLNDNLISDYCGLNEIEKRGAAAKMLDAAADRLAVAS